MSFRTIAASSVRPVRWAIPSRRVTSLTIGWLSQQMASGRAAFTISTQVLATSANASGDAPGLPTLTESTPNARMQRRSSAFAASLGGTRLRASRPTRSVSSITATESPAGPHSLCRSFQSWISCSKSRGRVRSMMVSEHSQLGRRRVRPSHLPQRCARSSLSVPTPRKQQRRDPPSKLLSCATSLRAAFYSVALHHPTGSSYAAQAATSCSPALALRETAT